MVDISIDRVASWLDGTQPLEATPAGEIWALVEVFGHRRHYGRIREVELAGSKMLRVDVPALAAAPLFGEAERFESHFYSGGAIFSLTPLTEAACRKAQEGDRPWSPRALPPPDDDEEPSF